MSIMRHPRTTQERRANGKRDILYFDDFRVHIRARRNFSNLPNSRDDIIRGDYSCKSWKKHRKTQYKEVKMGIGQQIVEGLQDFLNKLKKGDPIRVRRVKRTETPDGPMHEFTDLMWTTGPDGKPMRRPESVPDPDEF